MRNESAMREFLDGLTLYDIEDLASETTVTRGHEYFREGRVQSLDLSGDTLRALVLGSEPQPYRVAIEVDKQGLRARCTCPFDSEPFCKHAIAALLFWAEKQGEVVIPEPPGREAKGVRGPPSMGEVRRQLLSWPQDELVDYILEEATEFPQLRHRVELRLAVREGGERAATALEAELKRVLRRRSLDYDEVLDVAEELSELLHHLRVLADRDPELALTVAERFLKRAERLFGHIDDSQGAFGEVIYRLLALMVDLVRSGGKDRERVLTALFRRMVEDETGYYDSLREILATRIRKVGVRRLLEYLAREELHKMPSLTAPNVDLDALSLLSFRRALVTDFLIDLRMAEGDIEGAPDLAVGELPTTGDYSRVLDILGQAGRWPEVVAWGQRAIAADRDHPSILERLAAAQEHLGHRGGPVQLGETLPAAAQP